MDGHRRAGGRKISQNQWDEVDRHFGGLLLKSGPELDAALEASSAAGLPPIAVSPLHGKFLHLLAAAQRAERILEIGTLAGYSAIWMAKALPEHGRLITLEHDRRHAAVAAENIRRANLQNRIEIRIGDALGLLPEIEKQAGPFDLVFIDADKENNPQYFSWALKLAARGGLIVIDNVVRGGQILDAGSADAAIQGIRRLHHMVAEEPRATATAIQTVGLKGYDGFMLIRVN